MVEKTNNENARCSDEAIAEFMLEMEAESNIGTPKPIILYPNYSDTSLSFGDAMLIIADGGTCTFENVKYRLNEYGKLCSIWHTECEPSISKKHILGKWFKVEDE